MVSEWLKYIFIFCLPLHNPIAMSQNTFTPEKILIITTGGTIGSTSEAGNIRGKSLIESVPEIARYAEADHYEFSEKGSSKITPADWLRLGQLINGSLEKYRGFVITHGTDSMEETAFFLNLTVKSEFPVVLTGSMRPSDFVSADGPANVINAVRVAVAPASLGQGVLIVMNDMISCARDTWKTDDLRLQSFQSPSFGHLGVVDPDTVVYYRQVTHLHTKNTPFDISGVEILPRVDLLSDFTGLSPDIIKNVFDLPSDGLVLQSFAGGRTSTNVHAKLESWNSGKPVLVASRVPMGRIPSQDMYGDAVFIAADLPANKARILLMLALTLNDEHVNIKELFSRF
jgi:L-asparaginase